MESIAGLIESLDFNNGDIPLIAESLICGSGASETFSGSTFIIYYY